MNAGRLIKLAKHLESGKLGHKRFDFSQFNGEMDPVEPKPYTCGTAGCALGECPIIFPKQWRFDSNSFPALRRGDASGYEAGAEFFGLNGVEVRSLFDPSDSGLGGKATRKQVAKRIRQFVAAKQIVASNPFVEVVVWTSAD